MSSAAQGSEQYVLAIDVGSGSVKAVLVSRGGELAGTGFAPIDTILVPGGGAEHDPDQWWRASGDASRAALREAAIDPAAVIAVACTTQWAVTVPVDRDGRTLGNALSWLDTRGGPYSRAIAGGFPSLHGYGAWKLGKWLHITGGAPTLSGVDGLGHIQYWKHKQPNVYREAFKFLEPMDYLNLRLTGRFAASFSTIFPYWVTDNRDPNRVVYHDGLLRLAGIDRAKLPDLLPVDAVLGELTAEAAGVLGLVPGTKVVMGSGDSHSATIGAGTVNDYQGYFCIGTSAWMSCHVPRKRTDVVHLLNTMPAAIPGRYIVGAEQGVAGRCLEFLKDKILFPGGSGGTSGSHAEDGYAVLNAEASRIAPGSDGLMFTPWINGVLAPGEDPYTRSAFFNQSVTTTRGHYARAVMEGVAYNLRWLKGHVERFIGRRFEHLGFIGGGATSGTWCQILADILECPIRQVANARHAGAVGAALAAFAALGSISLDQIPAKVKIEHVFQPDPDASQVYRRRFPYFLELYRRMKPIYRRMNRD